MKLRRTYESRFIQFQQVRHFDGWRIKLYSITRQDSVPIDDTFVETCTDHVFGHLRNPESLESTHGVGFFIIHQGEHRNWLLLDWWYDQEILKHKLFSSPLDQPKRITEAESDLMACTWEMAIQCFERQAWIDTVLKNPDRPDFDAYLATQLNAEI
ncbi:MAG: hypothetical protein AAGG48_25345 [Planctomycetota bacterium]